MAEENDIPSLAAATDKVDAVKAEALLKIKKYPWLPWAGGGLLALIILLLVLGPLFRQGRSGVPAEQWQQYHSDSLGFSLSHPANWTVTETDATSGPDILIAEQGGSAFVRIRGFLDVNLNSPEAITASVEQYQKSLALQPEVDITSLQSATTDANVSEFTLTGELPVAGSIYSFEEKGLLSTTGRVLLMRAADLPTDFDGSLSTLRAIMDSFTLEPGTDSAFFTAQSAFAAGEPRQPLASMGEVVFNITDHQANSVAVSDTRGQIYTARLRGNIINAGIPLRASDNTIDQLNQLREENNQLNQGQGGRHLITNQSGDTFWGHKKFNGDIPQSTYRLDTRINVFHRDASGARQDLFVTVNIYDSKSGELVGTASASRVNTQRIRNQQYVGPEPTWWQKYISGYAREITYEDVLEAVIAEASSDVVSQLSALQNQDIESDADRFARSLEESGYKPLIPDSDESDTVSGRAADVADGSSSDPNCPFWVRYVDGPRLCFWTQEEALDFAESGGLPPKGDLNDTQEHLIPIHSVGRMVSAVMAVWLGAHWIDLPPTLNLDVTPRKNPID